MTATNQQIAVAWRATQPEPRRSSGVVLVWDGQVYGWKDALREPQHERPGAVAVDVNGRVWIAEGGNDANGAKQWLPEPHPLGSAPHPADDWDLGMLETQQRMATDPVFRNEVSKRGF